MKHVKRAKEKADRFSRIISKILTYVGDLTVRRRL